MRSTLLSRLALSIAATLLVMQSATALQDVPVRESHKPGFENSCGQTTVFGLKAGGDGFLSVRSGPGVAYREIDRLHNDDVVFVVEERGNWFGIYYGVKEVACNTHTGPLATPKQGWVNKRWIAIG